MLTREKTRNVVKSNTGRESSFTISASAKAFRILSSTIYKNKIGAIIRELAANACDSHIAAGCPEKPIKIKLPSSLDTEFYVQDEGLGLSEDSVFDIFTTYFESTKTEDEQATGCLGLGSKSPFSYIETYIVTSVFEGERIIYSAYIGEDGKPNIAEMDRTETTDHNGVKISFNVSNKGDHSRFVSESKEILQSFSSAFEVVNDNWKLPKRDIEQEGTGWRVYSTYSGKSGAYAVMANVAYPLDGIDKFLNTKHLNFLTETDNLYIDFDNGALDFAPSREELNFDRYTIKNIIKRLKEVSREIGAKYQKELDACKTDYEARRLLYDYTSSHLHSKFIKSSELYYKGALASSELYIFDEEGAKDKTMKPQVNMSVLAKSKKINSVYSRIKHLDPGTKIVPSIKSGFIVVNTKSGFTPKAKQYCSDNDLDRCYVIHTYDKQVNDHVKYLLEDLGNPEYSLTSDITVKSKKGMVGNELGTTGVLYPVRLRDTEGRYSSSSKKLLDNKYSSTGLRCIDYNRKQMTDDKLFAEEVESDYKVCMKVKSLSGNIAYTPDGEQTQMRDLIHKFNRLSKVYANLDEGLVPGYIYVANERNHKYLDDSWTDISDVIVEMEQVIFDKITHYKERYCSNPDNIEPDNKFKIRNKELREIIYEKCPELIPIIETNPASRDFNFASYGNILNTLRMGQPSDSRLHKLSAEITDRCEAEQDRRYKVIESFYNDYPMLDLVFGGHGESGEPQVMIDYIKEREK